MKIKITIEDLEQYPACDAGLEEFEACYPDGYEAEWTLDERLRLVKSPMRKYLGWAEDCKLLPAVNLSNADLRAADLCNADLSWAVLRGVNLSNADLRRVNLNNADLRNADLRNADLRNADLRNAYLREANLRNADLRGVNLSFVDLRNVDLRGVDLRNATMLEEQRQHAGKGGGIVDKRGDMI